MRLQYVTHRSCGGMIVAIQNVFASVDFHKFTIQLEQERVYICTLLQFKQLVGSCCLK